jgi:hypothetical protein
MNIILKIILPAVLSLVGWYIAGILYDKWEEHRNGRE